MSDLGSVGGNVRVDHSEDGWVETTTRADSGRVCGDAHHVEGSLGSVVSDALHVIADHHVNGSDVALVVTDADVECADVLVVISDQHHVGIDFLFESSDSSQKSRADSITAAFLEELNFGLGSNKSCLEGTVLLNKVADISLETLNFNFGLGAGITRAERIVPEARTSEGAVTISGSATIGATTIILGSFSVGLDGSDSSDESSESCNSLTNHFGRKAKKFEILKST